MEKNDITESERTKLIKEFSIKDLIGDQEKKITKSIKPILTNFNAADFNLDDTKQEDSKTKTNKNEITKK
tara:strand:- start:41726 stop:41935 length:210 start_codon:yes stop_codon:yes gene_type:complete